MCLELNSIKEVKAGGPIILSLTLYVMKNVDFKVFLIAHLRSESCFRLAVPALQATGRRFRLSKPPSARFVFFRVRYPVRLEGSGALAPYHHFVEGVRFTDLFHESSLEVLSARGFLSVYCIVGSVLNLFHPSSKVFSFGSGNMSVVRRLKSPGMALSSAGLVS
ncbi:unnamed protein product [Brassica oleracea var. botrytis]